MTPPEEPESGRVELRRHDAPIGQLSPQPWMQAPETRAVIAALSAGGNEPRFAGGCVRDALLRRPVRDIDIATPDRPERVMELLEAAGIRAIPTGIEHGTVTALVGEKHFEITTLRVDVDTDGRHARVAFTDDWVADAHRRDFTMNALYALPDGRIVDPCDGLPDLGAGRVCFVGDPHARIAEDGLRILRFFRFYAHYGSPPPDPAALAACRAQAEMLDQLSGERIRSELFRLLEAPSPEATLLLMQVLVLPRILPEAQDFGRLRLLTFIETRGIVHPGVQVDTLRRLAALLPPDAKLAEAVADRLKLSRKERDRLRALVAPGSLPEPEHDEIVLESQLDREGGERFRDLVMLSWSARMSIHGHAGKTDAWVALLDRAAAWRPQPLPVDGDDVIEAGVAPGPRVGALLAALYDWWLQQSRAPDRDALLARLAAMVASGQGGASEDGGMEQE